MMESAYDTGTTGEFRRRHGLHRPFDVLQVISWFLFAYLNISFYILLAPLLDIEGAWLFVGFEACLGITCFGLALFCCKADSIDMTASSATGRASMDLLYCYYCKRQVHKKSKHCRACNKCIAHFDHHCRWLNTCVGARTYTAFFVLIVIVFVFVAVHLSCAGLVLYRWGVGGQAWAGNAGLNGHLVFFSHQAVLAFVVVTEVISLVCLGMIGNLLFFHMYLRAKKLSTYDYIVRQREHKAHRKKSRIAPELDENAAPAAQVITKWTEDNDRKAEASGSTSAVMVTGDTTPAEFVVEMPPLHPGSPNSHMSSSVRSEARTSTRGHPHRNVSSNSSTTDEFAASAPTGPRAPSPTTILSAPPRPSRLPLPAELPPVAAAHVGRDSWDVKGGDGEEEDSIPTRSSPVLNLPSKHLDT